MGLKSWEDLRKEARDLERDLENNISQYSSFNSSSIKSSSIEAPEKEDEDAENPSEESKKERELMLEIERQLSMLSEVIDEMVSQTNSSTSAAQSALAQRYREVYFDFNTEFKRTMASIQHKRDSARLFSRSNKSTAPDDEMDLLLRERSTVSSTRSMTDNIIGQALAAKDSLFGQRDRFTRTNASVQGLSSSFSGINTLVDQIRKKKIRNNTIIALVVAALICFTLWWTILSHT